MGYDDRIKILKQRKLEETQIKSKMKVYQDGDDYGSIPAPENYQFHCIPNHENGSWYGYDGWSKNFHKLMSEHPVYIDRAKIIFQNAQVFSLFHEIRTIFFYKSCFAGS